MRLMIPVLCFLVLLISAVPAAALKTEQLAAEKDKAAAGDVTSQVNVGDYHYARSEYAEALPWYRMAAKQGQFDSRMRIAYMHIKGEGTPRDLVKGYVLLCRIMFFTRNHSTRWNVMLRS